MGLGEFSVTSRDDGYHPLDSDNFYEWWYFDGIFTNGYSFAITYHFGTPHKKRRDARFIEYGLYDPQRRKRFSRTRIPIPQCRASEELCDVVMGRNMVKGNLQKVHLSFEEKGMGCHLTFESMTPGFRPPNGLLHSGSPNSYFFGWACIQPRAKVEGHLLVNGEKMPVKGEGYHDHNWGDVPVSYFFDYWYWVKLFLPGYTFNCDFSRGSEQYGFSELDHWIVGFKGRELIQWTHAVIPEMSDFFKEPTTSTDIPRRVKLTAQDTKIQGTINCYMKKLLESFPMPGEQRGYFRFLMDCQVRLQIGSDLVNEDVEVVTELMKPPVNKKMKLGT